MIVAALGFGLVAAAGTLLRWQASSRLPRPAGTLLVNLVGTFTLGAAAGLEGLTATIVGTAGLGALTTFSTVMAELVDLWSVDRRRSIAYGIVTSGAGLGAAWLGLELAA